MGLLSTGRGDDTRSVSRIAVTLKIGFFGGSFASGLPQPGASRGFALGVGRALAFGVDCSDDGCDPWYFSTSTSDLSPGDSGVADLLRKGDFSLRERMVGIFESLLEAAAASELNPEGIVEDSSPERDLDGGGSGRSEKACCTLSNVGNVDKG